MEQKKRYKKGFVLGKFMPPHAGHLHLIHTAMQQTEELRILVCTVQREPIAGALRYAWMQQLLPGADVVHVSEEVPSYPHEHPDFETIWTDLLQRYTDPDTEVFFSSEAYGDDVARWLGIAHEPVDPDRKAVPVSGTAIRDFPFANWQHLPAAVRPHFLKRIVLTGPESSGKTTMAALLAEALQTGWVEEYGRQHFVEREGKLTVEDITLIAEGQIRLENKAAETANKWLICDTDLIVTQIWSEIYFKTCPPEVIAHSHARSYDFHFLMDIDFPWENDGTREFPHLRSWHFNRIKAELDARGLPYVLVSGNPQERLAKMLEVVSRMAR